MPGVVAPKHSAASITNVENPRPSDPYALDARWYDLLHEGFEEDIALWQSFAARTDAPVLEVGCGSGRIAVPLALAGADVTGIDPSPAMLARARERAKGESARLSLLEGRLEDVELPAERFGFALVANDVFLFAQNGDEQVDFLRRLAGAMQFNATLALDLPGPALHLDPTANGQPLLVFDGETNKGEWLTVWHLREDDLALQQRHLTVLYELVGDDGLLRRYRSEHKLRYVYRFEMEYLLREAGLRLLDVYGDYQLGELTNDSDRMIVTAMRAHG